MATSTLSDKLLAWTIDFNFLLAQANGFYSSLETILPAKSVTSIKTYASLKDLGHSSAVSYDDRNPIVKKNHKITNNSGDVVTLSKFYTALTSWYATNIQSQVTGKLTGKEAVSFSSTSFESYQTNFSKLVSNLATIYAAQYGDVSNRDDIKNLTLIYTTYVNNLKVEVTTITYRSK